jgi:hypothetical protein
LVEITKQSFPFRQLYQIMKTKTFIALGVISAGSFAGANAAVDPSPWNIANQNQERALERAGLDHLVQAGEVDAAWLASARATYPLATCVVSGKAVSNGFDYVFVSRGSPDRLVRLASAQFVSTFLQNPARYLAVIDAAAAKRH